MLVWRIIIKFRRYLPSDLRGFGLEENLKFDDILPECSWQLAEILPKLDDLDQSKVILTDS
jgi:hypothetical protein